MMELLQKSEAGGAPLEYLVARIRGSRGALVADWPALVFTNPPAGQLTFPHHGRGLARSSQEDVWRDLLQEFAWAYLQLDAVQRERFSPLFVWIELRTIILCLRNRQGGGAGKIAELLSFSLLANKVKRIIIEQEEPRAAIDAIERVLVFHSLKFTGLAACYAEQGLAFFEQELARRFLEYLHAAEPRSEMADFIGRLVDIRNILTLHKQQRWRIKIAPLWVKGGRIGVTELQETLDSMEAARVFSLIARLSGMAVEKPGMDNVEHSLLQGMTLLLRRKALEPSGMGLVLDYLWRVYLQARNLGLLLYGSDMERELLASEIIS